MALGDVSDFSHVEAAALNCFCAVLVVDAATDTRERSFANQAYEIVEGWAGAVRNAGLQRIIWVSGDGSLVPFPSPAPEVATVVVGSNLEEATTEVARLEEIYRFPA